jgi:hypothetical protein
LCYEIIQPRVRANPVLSEDGGSVHGIAGRFDARKALLNGGFSFRRLEKLIEYAEAYNQEQAE